MQDLHVTDILPQMIPLSESYIQVGITSLFCCHYEYFTVNPSFLGHLSTSGDLLLWVGVRRRVYCLMSELLLCGFLSAYKVLMSARN